MINKKISLGISEPWDAGDFGSEANIIRLFHEGEKERLIVETVKQLEYKGKIYKYFCVGARYEGEDTRKLCDKKSWAVTLIGVPDSIINDEIDDKKLRGELGFIGSIKYLK